MSHYTNIQTFLYHNPAAGQYWSSRVRVLTQTVGGSWILCRKIITANTDLWEDSFPRGQFPTLW